VTKLRLRIVDGFDGSWIMLLGVDGQTHYVDSKAYEATPNGDFGSSAAVRRMRSEFDEWGAAKWRDTYEIPRAAVEAA
jgi:hypothetical protein